MCTGKVEHVWQHLSLVCLHTVSKRQEPRSKDWHMAVVAGSKWSSEWELTIGSLERRPTKTGEWLQEGQGKAGSGPRAGVPSPHKVSFQKISTGGKQERTRPPAFASSPLCPFTLNFACLSATTVDKCYLSVLPARPAAFFPTATPLFLYS